MPICWASMLLPSHPLNSPGGFYFEMGLSEFKTGLELSVAQEGPELVIVWPKPYAIWDCRPGPPGLDLAQNFCVCLCAYTYMCHAIHMAFRR